MVNNEIKIIVEENLPPKRQGEVLEKLVKWVLQTHQYEVKENLHFTGSEIDLVAKHKHKNEQLYVECKAKEKVTSLEIKNFVFNHTYRKADYGYFIRTQEIEQQAGALIEELSRDDRYKNVTFFEPSKLIQIFEEASLISRVTIPANLRSTKRILCLTYKGDYLVYIINQSSVLPSHFVLLEANNGTDVIDEKKSEFILSKVDEIAGLKQILLQNSGEAPVKQVSLKDEIESLSEVQSSITWHDYLPASAKHFVGRDAIRNSFFDYFKEVHSQSNKKRVFYLTGKSGWGKSSLVVEIKDRCRNQYYRNKFFALAIDSRSATSNNFVALSFERLIRNALKEGFIEDSIFLKEIQFTSNIDLFRSESIQEIITVLKKSKKYLILIFDQFEDIFRKEGLFKSFYKFLSDVTDLQGNIIVGFSWKTEILIPSDNEAYHYWQQAKEQAIEFVVPEFGLKEITGVIKQLEKSTTRLNDDLQRRIKENSQGLPWLTKKLCIHIFNQLKANNSQERLIDENLNIEDLFKGDLEKLGPGELRALEFIAKRAYDGNFFEVSELGERVSEAEVDSLRDKRLIIRSGANYNIYWDIFRDYLVTKEIPQIGESYLLRYGVNSCLMVYKLFKNNTTHTLDELEQRHPRGINKATLENTLIELRTIGLVKKSEYSESFSLVDNNTVPSDASFKKFIKDKFQNYSPYLRLAKYSKRTIITDDLVDVLKNIFRGFTFQDKTWLTYSTTLMGWFRFADLSIVSKFEAKKRGRGTNEIVADTVFLRSSPEDIFNCVKKMAHGGIPPRGKIRRDLYVLSIVDEEGQLIDDTLINLLDDLKSFHEELLPRALAFPKMEKVKTLVEENRINARELVELLPEDFFENQKMSSKVVYATTIKSWFKKAYKRRAKTDTQVMLFSPATSLTNALRSFINEGQISKHANRDLKLLGIINNGEIEKSEKDKLSGMNFDETKSYLKQLAKEIPKIKHVSEILSKNPGIKLNELSQLVPKDFFGNRTGSSATNYLSIIKNWASN